MRSDEQSLRIFWFFCQISNDMITRVKFSQQTNSFPKLHLPNIIPKGEIRSKKGPQLQQSIGTVGLNDCEGASGNPRAPGVSGSWIATPYKCGANKEIQYNVNMGPDHIKIEHRQKELAKNFDKNCNIVLLKLFYL